MDEYISGVNVLIEQFPRPLYPTLRDKLPEDGDEIQNVRKEALYARRKFQRTRAKEDTEIINYRWKDFSLARGVLLRVIKIIFQNKWHVTSIQINQVSFEEELLFITFPVSGDHTELLLIRRMRK